MRKTRISKTRKKKQDQSDLAPIAQEVKSSISISSEESSRNAQSAIGDQGQQPRASLKKFLVPVLRRATYRWSPRSEALKRARKERNSYECAMCKMLFQNSKVVLDHIVPVVDPKSGFTNWDEYINRMFPEIDGFQVLCYDCHDIKTVIEDEMRKHFTKKRKSDVKNEK